MESGQQMTNEQSNTYRKNAFVRVHWSNIDIFTLMAFATQNLTVSTTHSAIALTSTIKRSATDS